MNIYKKLSDVEKKQIILQEYQKNCLSFGEIAKKYNTYSNQIRRDAIKFKIKIRDKSDAQKTALKSGRHKHPTKGQTRSEITKNKIGKGVLESWESLSDKELNRRKGLAKANWEKLDDEEKQYILQKANQAVRASSNTGSKLEIHIFNKLLSNGYEAQFHKEHTLLNTKLQIDLFLPKIGVAIEIDGPSHHLPVWGEDSLQKSKKYDNKKNGLILGKGLVLIRIKQNKDFSKSRADMVWDKLSAILDTIKKDTNTKNNNYIELGDE